MLFTRKIGNAEVSNVIEYSGPTHDPGLLFPDMPREIIEENLHWLAPNHFSRRLNKFVVTIQKGVWGPAEPAIRRPCGAFPSRLPHSGRGAAKGA